MEFCCGMEPGLAAGVGPSLAVTRPASRSG